MPLVKLPVLNNERPDLCSPCGGPVLPQRPRHRRAGPRRAA